MKTCKFLRWHALLAAALACFLLLMLTACTDENKQWEVTMHKTYYNNQQIKVVAQNETLLAVYDATVTSKHLLLGWRASDDKSWLSVAVYFDGTPQQDTYIVEEFIDGNDFLYNAVKIRSLSPSVVKLEVTYRQGGTQSHEYQLPQILQAVETYATEKALNIF